MTKKIVEVSPAEVREFTTIVTYLEVRRWKDVLPLLPLGRRVQQQLRSTEGVVRYGIRTDFLHKRFWTYSVWKNREAIRPFVTTGQHSKAVKKFAEFPGAYGAFAEWSNTDGNIDWEEADRRLMKPAFYRQN